MNTSKWWEFVESVADGAANVEIARRADFDPSAISRWKRGDRPDVLFVVKFAHAYQVNVLKALVAAGYISEDDANLREVKIGLGDLSTGELARELARRLDDDKNVTK